MSIDQVLNQDTQWFLQQQRAQDFLKNIPKNAIDLVLIDPPYLISRSTGFESGNDPKFDRLKVSMDFGDWDSTAEFLESDLEAILIECYRVLRKGGTLICFFDLFKITTLKEMLQNSQFKQIRFLEWIKTNPVPLNQSVNYLTNAREIALLGVKVGKPTFNSKYDNGIYHYPIEHHKGRFHPTQKNVALIQELIRKHSNVGDLVMDCFSGSGTTAVAALEEKRRFIGCEIHDVYFPKAVDRIVNLVQESKDSQIKP